MITNFPDAEHLAVIGDFHLVSGWIPQIMVLPEENLHLGS